MTAALTLVPAVLLLFVLLPVLALRWGRSPRWNRPVPEAPVDVLNRHATDMHLSVTEMDDVQRCVRRGLRAEDARLRPVVAGVASSTIQARQRPDADRNARALRLVVPVVLAALLVVTIVLFAIGHPHQAARPLTYFVIYAGGAVLAYRRRHAAQRALQLNSV